ncbi:MAG: DUF423 domain-containing protein [Bacteroidota bacterium]
MKKLAYLSGAAMGGLAVIIGAFGAHALEERLMTNGHLDTFETGAKYHMYHALFLLFLGMIAEFGESKWLRVATWTGLIGLLVFSFSLYFLSVLDIPKLGMVTPLGGTLLIVAWLTLFIHLYRRLKAT